MRVRLVQANGLDLSLFQFDYDLTFAAFFLNADRTIYGRFGSRSDSRQADKDISLDGFRKAMLAALDLHKNYPGNRASLSDKQPRRIAAGNSPRYKVPEEYPSLAGKYKTAVDYEGKPTRSCLHCHQVHEAERAWFRAPGRAFPDEVLFPYPMPDAIGLALDPNEEARVTGVVAESPAAAAGFKKGDEILSLQDQPIISIADVQWVLHNTLQPAQLKAGVLRSGKQTDLVLNLPQGWRRKSDISWRASMWDLRRMALGGLVLQELTERKKREVELPRDSMALRVNYVGQYDEHATGKKAGFVKDDILVNVAGQSGAMSEGQLLAWLLQHKTKGERVPIKILRGEKSLNLELPMQ